MTPFAYDVLGASLGIGGGALALVSRYWPRPRFGPEPETAVPVAVPAPAAAVFTPGPVPQVFRYCPAELRVCAAVPHRDGSATCNCGANIPAAGGEQQ